ncbi:hypothetical protein ABEW03_14950, partial [Virgibacillus pantothenticus]|uniref:hypothetical protein n=1 Tax=Virgibacillus pantothenticus TaxID=1473 RepID=UPI003D2913C1
YVAKRASCAFVHNHFPLTCVRFKLYHPLFDSKDRYVIAFIFTPKFNPKSFRLSEVRLLPETYQPI